MASWYQWDQEDLLLNIRVLPNASRDEIVGTHDDALKIRITVPPVDGKANAHLLKFLAKTFAVSKASVELISGDTGRNKRLRIRRPVKLPESISR